jgi:hypothetical protein
MVLLRVHANNNQSQSVRFLVVMFAASATDRLVTVNDICGGLGREPVMAQPPRPNLGNDGVASPCPSLMLGALRKICEARPLVRTWHWPSELCLGTID